MGGTNFKPDIFSPFFRTFGKSHSQNNNWRASKQKKNKILTAQNVAVLTPVALKVAVMEVLRATKESHTCAKVDLARNENILYRFILLFN